MANISDHSKEFTLELWADLLANTLQIESDSIKIIYAIFMGIMCTLGLFGNMVTCYVIYFGKSMQTSTNYYLFNLAVSDLILTIAIMLEFFDQIFPSYPYSEWMCKVQWFAVGCLWNQTILTISALAIERYIAIWYPMKLKSSSVWRRMVKTIVLLWIVAIAETLSELFIVDLIKSRQNTVCFVVPTPSVRVLNGVLAILTFAIPLLIITVVYSTIVFKVNNRNKSLQHKGKDHQDPSGRVNTLMVAMTLSFLICWMPYFIERVLIAAVPPHKLLALAEWWGFLTKCVIISGWISVVLNPIIFSLVSTKFRRALMIRAGSEKWLGQKWRQIAMLLPRLVKNIETKIEQDYL